MEPWLLKVLINGRQSRAEAYRRFDTARERLGFLFEPVMEHYVANLIIRKHLGIYRTNFLNSDLTKSFIFMKEDDQNVYRGSTTSCEIPTVIQVKHVELPSESGVRVEMRKDGELRKADIPGGVNTFMESRGKKRDRDKVVFAMR